MISSWPATPGATPGGESDTPADVDAKRPVLIVGGEHHGYIVYLPNRVDAWYTADEDGLNIQRHPVRRAWYVFPGRTEVQTFQVAGAAAGLGCPNGARADIVADAARIAWSNGWTPPDPPVPLSRIFVHAGTAWIAGPL